MESPQADLCQPGVIFVYFDDGVAKSRKERRFVSKMNAAFITCLRADNG